MGAPPGFGETPGASSPSSSKPRGAFYSPAFLGGKPGILPHGRFPALLPLPASRPKGFFTARRARSGEGDEHPPPGGRPPGVLKIFFPAAPLQWPQGRRTDLAERPGFFPFCHALGPQMGGPGPPKPPTRGEFGVHPFSPGFFRGPRKKLPPGFGVF